MGCFGDMTPTKDVATTTSSTTAPPSWVQSAGQDNYTQARGVLDAGFVPYTGEKTAPLSSDEIAAGNLVDKTAATTNPYAGQSASDFNQYGSTPGYNYNFSTVVDPNGPLGSVQSYMDPYVQATLDPTLRQIGISGAQARQGIDANAIQSGAFGDARHGVVESEQLKNQSLQEGDATAQAYDKAYTSAMANRQQDASRQFSTQQAQNSADEASLARLRTSGQDLTNLDASGVSRALGLASAQGQVGATARGVQQQADTANQAEFMRQQGFTDQQISFLTSVLSGTPTAQTTTGNSDQITSQPDNSGWQALAALGGAILKPFSSPSPSSSS